MGGLDTIDPEDAAAMAERIQHLATDPDQLARMSRKARASVVDQECDYVAEEEKLYRDVVGDT